MRIAVIGTGLIGQAWAIVFARGKHEVRLWDGFAEATAKAMPLIAEQLNDLHQAGLIDEPAAALLARIKGFDKLEDALEGAVGERQRHGVALHHARPGHARRCDRR